MIRVLILTGLIAAPLGACAVSHDLETVRNGDAIVFEDMRGGGHCLTQFSVQRERDDLIVWAVTKTDYLEPPCPNRFPLTYGVTPEGMTVETPASPLEQGVVYRLRGWDRDFYSGAFRIDADGQVEVLDFEPG